ncbi:MAG TPA: hypothetical protein VFR55_07705 [Dehalococcoidia bacterium]|nr:hypothetical protein [Dehalococcoidia bacterium]
MFGSVVLEVAIGLVLIYLVLSLVCSSITEWISRAFAMRSRTLYAGVRNFLGDDPTRTDQLAGKLADRIYEHPLIKGLYQSKGLLKKGDGTKGGPSNIPSRAMALALFDTILEAGEPESADPQGDGRPGGPAEEENADITGNGTSMALQREARRRLIELEQKIKTNPDLPDSLRKSLTRIIETARSETDRYDTALATARVATEQWFDDAMDRVSGWYKRQTQLIILGLALVVSFGFNVDTIAIANTLYRDDTVRRVLVAQAETQLQDGTGSTAAQVKIENLGIPLGWSVGDFPDSFPGWGIKFFGLCFTSIAVALGAPFWFDLLNRLVSLRGAGGSPQKSTSTPAAIA